MNITPIQADFSVGEVSRDAKYRSTLDARNRGVKTLTNFVTNARGPVIRRKGFRFLGKVGESSSCDLLSCSPAIYPVEDTDPVGFISDISGNNESLAVQVTNAPYKGDGVPDAVWKYTSTDVPPGKSGVSWDMGYVLGGSGEGHYGIGSDRNIGQWTLTKGFIEFYMKRRAYPYSSLAADEYIIHPYGAGSGVIYGCRIYLSPEDSPGPGRLSVEIGMIGTNAYLQYRMTNYDIDNGVWYKVRFEWNPDMLSALTWEEAGTLYIDDVTVPMTNEAIRVDEWRPSDIANYSSVVDPERDLIKLRIGARNTADAGETGFNGMLDDIYISNCDYEECLP